MPETNNIGSFEKKSSDVKVAVNSIQRTLYVKRLHVDIAYPVDKIIPYDKDNHYPNKVKEIAQRSGTTMGAINKYSEFISGEGFEGMDTEINRKGQSLWDILRHISYSKAMFKGYALHFNYNVLGQITEINPINFEFVRWHRDLNKLVVNCDWIKRRNLKQQEEEYYPYDPSNVGNEIMECGGIGNYNGQLFYWIPNLSDWYTPCTWDSAIDDAQFEAEAKLYSLSSIQNDYSLSGYILYPKNITDKGDIDAIKEEYSKDKGSSNAGGVRVIGTMPVEGMNNWKLFHPISRNNIDNLHTNQKEDSRFNIYATFNMPPILCGVAKGGMFNQESFADAFHYYNSATETDRKDTEKDLTKILENSIWDIGDIQIKPKNFQMRQAGQIEQTKNNDPIEGGDNPAEKSINSTLTNLTGRQLQGVFRITKRFHKNELTYDQAAIMLRDGYGFDEEQMKVWLINDNE